MEINSIIMQEINNFCKKENIKVLLVVEAGSRTWGFESKDSDYDVRFVYIREKEDYLKLNNIKDNVELVHTDDLDIVGWDISKFLRLMYKSNPSVYEWLNSNVYYEDESFAIVRNIASCYYDNIKTAWHYYSMSENHDRRYIRNRVPTKKKYLHAVRATLSAIWAYHNKDIFPPTNFDQLKILLNEKLIPIVDGIIIDKKCGIADLQCENIAELDNWLEKNNDFLFKSLKQIKDKSQNEWICLNQAFLELLEER